MGETKILLGLRRLERESHPFMAHWKKRETLFSEYGIELTMPGAWQLRPSTGPQRWMYRSTDHREHLTITMGDAEKARNPGEMNAILRRSVERQRRAVELSYGRMPELTISETEYGERSETPAGWYRGSAGSKHRFWALLLFTPDAVWALFYEAFNLSEEAAGARAQATFETISIRK